MELAEMTGSLVIAACMFFAFLPWFVLLVILANMALGNYRRWKRSGRAMDPGDRDFIRLCYVTLLVAVWLIGW